MRLDHRACRQYLSLGQFSAQEIDPSQMVHGEICGLSRVITMIPSRTTNKICFITLGKIAEIPIEKLHWCIIFMTAIF